MGVALPTEMARRNGLLGGRPRGSETVEGKLKRKALSLFNKRVAKMTDKLLNAQSIVAMGSHKMLRPFMGEDGLPHVETIRDMDRMQKLIDEGEYGKDYLIVVGELPDWKAANALLDRTYGKAKESITLDGEVKFSLKDLAARRQEMLKGEVREAPAISAPVTESSDAKTA